MKYTPTVPIGFADQKIIKIFTDIVRSLTNVVECSTHEVTTVWKLPFTLTVPLTNTLPRKFSPDSVRLVRAQPDADMDASMSFIGPVAWKWAGGNKITITDADGIYESVKYHLTFEVTG